MAEPNLLAQLDQAIGDFVGSWDVVSTIIVVLAISILVSPLILGEEPDLHPFMLARQAQSSPIRQQGESAVYRSSDLGYGRPLRTGLEVKDPDAPRWTSGRDGDVRDVWRRAVKGPTKEDGTSAGPRGKLHTLLGTQKVVDHDLDGLTAEINIIGKYIQGAGGKKVAVHLTNSVELLASVFVGAFYQLSVVLVPYGSTPREHAHLIAQANVDTLIAEAGSVALDEILTKKSTIKRIIWVPKAGSLDIDWDEIPEGAGGKVEVSTWHVMVNENKATASREVLPVDKNTTPPPLSAFWPGQDGKFELIEYSSQNITSSVAAIIASFPRTDKLGPSETLLPTSPLTDTYTLACTLAALFSHTTVLINSVAGDPIDITVSTRYHHPTIIVASSDSIKELHDRMVRNGILSSPTTYFARKKLKNGVISRKKFGATALMNFMKLKTLLISQRDTAPAASRLSSSVQATLRFALGARIGYALTTAKVAGAVTQTNMLDYRDKKTKVCVGAPVVSVEVNLAGEEDEMKKVDAVGKVVVKGPAVVNGESFAGKKQCTELDVKGMVDVDYTLVLV